jgi:DNA polymerase III delta prime subunit
MDHHAYLSYAISLATSAVPRQYHLQSADIAHIDCDSFGIGEARTLQLQATQTAVVDEGRVFVIITRGITVQAQNALLKLFEEPPSQSVFYLVLRPGTHIIPTLQSRLYRLDTKSSEAENTHFIEFRASRYDDRMKLIAEKVKTKDQVWIEAVFTGALTYAQQNDELKVKKSALLASQFAGSPGASKKMLLEEIALTV